MMQSNMKPLNVTVNCQALYSSRLYVPAELSFEEAIAYAKQHMDDIQVTPLEFVKDISLDEDNCDFE